MSPAVHRENNIENFELRNRQMSGDGFRMGDENPSDFSQGFSYPGSERFLNHQIDILGHDGCALKSRRRGADDQKFDFFPLKLPKKRNLLSREDGWLGHG